MATAKVVQWEEIRKRHCLVALNVVFLDTSRTLWFVSWNVEAIIKEDTHNADPEAFAFILSWIDAAPR